MIYLSPLLGSLIATIVMLTYAAFKSSLELATISALISIFPITFLIFSLISYVISIPIGFLLLKYKEKRFWSDNFFMFLSSVVGSLLGLVFSLISFNIEEDIIKTLFIFLSFFLGATFNSSLYISIKKELNKEKQ